MVYSVWCMVRTQVYLPEDLKLELRMYAASNAVPVSEVIRKAVRREIGVEKKSAGSTLARIIAIAGKGPKDLSSNFFEYAYGRKSSYAYVYKTKRRSK